MTASVSSAGVSHDPPAGLLADGPAEATLRELGEPVAVPAKALAGKRFLVVEDEPLVAMDIAAQLEDAGAEIVGPVGHAAAAQRLIEDEHLDAALLDANLAGVPVDAIAASLVRKDVPFAFVSGYGRESLPSRFAAAQVLSKPFSAEQLLELATTLAQHPTDRLRLLGASAAGSSVAPARSPVGTGALHRSR